MTAGKFKLNQQEQAASGHEDAITTLSKPEAAKS